MIMLDLRRILAGAGLRNLGYLESMQPSISLGSYIVDVSAWKHQWGMRGWRLVGCLAPLDLVTLHSPFTASR